MNAVFYVDTNVLLHYSHFADVKWFDICPDKSVKHIRIRVAPAVLDALDRLKYSHHNKSTRHRISQLLSCIDEIVESKAGAVKHGVFVEIDLDEPDFNTYQEFKLVSTSDDDRLLASILGKSRELRESHLYLVTNDIALKHKARSRDISVLKMPDELRLLEEPDRRDREVSELKTLLERQALRSPDLKLTFPGSIPWAEARLNIGAPPGNQQLQQKLREIQDAFPKQNESIFPDYMKKYSNILQNGEPDKVKFLDVLGALALEFGKISARVTNIKLDAFYREYQAYLAADAQYVAELSRTIQLRLVLENNGTCPAEDVDIQMRFPSGMQIMLKEAFRQRPAPPMPPGQSKPMNPPKVAAAQISAQTTFSFRSLADGTLCTTNAVRIKHLSLIPLPVLYITFDRDETVRSFKIDYVLHASNVPRKICGELNLKITRSQPKLPKPRVHRKRPDTAK